VLRNRSHILLSLQTVVQMSSQLILRRQDVIWVWTGLFWDLLHLSLSANVIPTMLTRCQSFDNWLFSFERVLNSILPQVVAFSRRVGFVRVTSVSTRCLSHVPTHDFTCLWSPLTASVLPGVEVAAHALAPETS